ncbi:MAG: DUF4252 domain-containing protein [Bacteroidales bacterium]|nr:DUF4252 domain-containing protein [Bacteroidales bacterium]
MKTRIKIFITLLIVAVAAIGASAQSAFFKECEKLPGVQTVYVSKLMLGMAAKSGITTGNVDVSSLVNKLDALEVINAEGEAVKTLEKKIQPLTGYETLLTVNDDGENVQILFKDLGKGRSEFRIVAHEPDQLAIVCFLGTMTMEEVIEAVNK